MTKKISHNTQVNMFKLTKMNETVESFGNEYYEELWYSIYPDGVNWENLFYMAQNPEIMEQCEREYIKICTLYMQHKA